MVISTHTLTWSVTGYAPWAGRGERISTHTLTWSVTRRECLCKECILISTHTLTWSVTKTYGQVRACISISTHTLTWSVTCAWRRALKTYGHFNSHAHVERDNRKTPPHFDNWHFNSHAHVERDFWELGILNAKKISTHTLTWSVTTVRSFLALSIPFQLTRSRGA